MHIVLPVPRHERLTVCDFDIVESILFVISKGKRLRRREGGEMRDSKE